MIKLPKKVWIEAWKVYFLDEMRTSLLWQFEADKDLLECHAEKNSKRLNK